MIGEVTVLGVPRLSLKETRWCEAFVPSRSDLRILFDRQDLI